MRVIAQVMIAVGAVAVLAQPVLAGPSQDRGLELAKISEAANIGWQGESGTMKLEIINAHGDVVERKMEMKNSEGVGKEGDKSIFAFNWPADVKGTKLLTWGHKDRDDDQWLYLPAIKRTKRISSTGKSGSFMGSEFSYEDLSSAEIEKYTYNFLREETIDGRKAWVNERFPKDKNSGYSKTITWMDQEYKNALKVEYYDRKGELLKVAEFKGYKKMGKFWRFDSISIKNVQTRKSSVMTWENRKLNQEFEDWEFEKDALE